MVSSEWECRIHLSHARAYCLLVPNCWWSIPVEIAVAIAGRPVQEKNNQLLSLNNIVTVHDIFCKFPNVHGTLYNPNDLATIMAKAEVAIDSFMYKWFPPTSIWSNNYNNIIYQRGHISYYAERSAAILCRSVQPITTYPIPRETLQATNTLTENHSHEHSAWRWAQLLHWEAKKMQL